MKNEPAFPVPENHEWTGITIRDYFAAKAMVGIVGDMKLLHTHSAESAWLNSNVARVSYAIADAMLKAREAA